MAGVIDARKLESMLRKECDLYVDYIALVKEERNWFTKLKAQRIEELTAKRQLICDSLLQMQDERMALMRTFPDGEGKKLSDLIRKHCPIREAKLLLGLTKKLRELISEAKTEGSHYSQIIGFSMGMVNGVLGILWTATQNVVKAYNRQGTVKEANNPAGNRASTILKRA